MVVVVAVVLVVAAAAAAEGGWLICGRRSPDSPLYEVQILFTASGIE